MTSMPHFSLYESGYAQLPERFFLPTKPTPVRRPAVVLWNLELAKELGLNGDPSGLATLLSGNDAIPGSKPVATVYAGHQFGHFVPQLGDGRSSLGPVIREYLASEAMHALGIPTKRAR